MIELLRVENLAIVESAELEFGPGLNVLTGETGAGKSVVLGALGLLAGARASSDSIRDGSDAAVVEAIFRTRALPELEAELAARGLEPVDHELVVRRTLPRAGRARAQLCGQLVPLATLAEIMTGRIEISSQHDSQSLLRPETHGRLLDRLGGLEKTRAAVAEGFAALRGLREELERLRGAAQEREQRRDFLAFQIKEIDAAALDVEEILQLRSLRGRLAHAERLRVDAGGALLRLSGDLEGEGANATDLLGEAVRALEALVKIDDGLGALAERLESARVEVQDAASDLEHYVAALDADPAQLAGADERLARVEQLQRKYGADVEAVLEFRAEAAEQLAAIEGADERESEILAECDRRYAELAEQAKSLSAGRKKAAVKLSRSVQAALRDLAMPDARFAVELEPAPVPDGAPCGPNGAEAPAFGFSANAGETPRPLRHVASGGELSRTFLAIKGSLREADAGMVLVFDEVDAGIGGRAADRVGRSLAELAAHHQVLCITHLPQIAAFADTHFHVEKSVKGKRASVRIARVEGDARIEEIARMAGGEQIGEATRRHARELLGSRATR